MEYRRGRIGKRTTDQGLDWESVINSYGRPVAPDGHGPDRPVDDRRAVVRRERPWPPVALRCGNRAKRDSWEPSRWRPPLRRYALRDDQFERIEHLLPGRPRAQQIFPALLASPYQFCANVVYRYRSEGGPRSTGKKTIEGLSIAGFLKGGERWVPAGNRLRPEASRRSWRSPADAAQSASVTSPACL
jgi:hypothetical protein